MLAMSVAGMNAQKIASTPTRHIFAKRGLSEERKIGRHVVAVLVYLRDHSRQT
jgi:hypothetical protein